MNTARPSSKVTRWLFVIFLCGVGSAALLVALMLGFGWMISETTPDAAHKVITGLFGLIVFASSIACFHSALRQIKHLRLCDRGDVDQRGGCETQARVDQ